MMIGQWSRLWVGNIPPFQMVAGFWNVSIDFPAPDMHAGEEDGDRRPSHRRESVGPDVLDDNMSIIVKIVKLIALGRRLLLKIRQDA